MANTKVTGDVIANGTISTVHLADDAITAAKLDSTATGITFADLTVDTDTLYVDAANNRLGIGTTSPSNKLFVTANTAGDYAAFIENTNSTNGYGLVARTASTGTASYAFAARAASTDIFVVRADGNVGIGTTSPGQKLVVIGNISTSGSVLFDDNQGINFGNSNAKIYGSSSDGIKFNASGSEAMRLNQSGNLGIGTTSPVTKLDVRGGSGGGSFDHATFTSVTNRGLKISTANSSEGQNGAAVIYNAQDGENYGSHAFQIGGSTKMFIKGNNVGIATTSPDYTLDVAGEIGLDSYLRHNGDSDTFFGFSGNDEIKFRTAGSDRIFINSSGNVGINETNPNAKLDVSGNVKLGSAAHSSWTDAKQDLGGVDIFVGSGSKAFQVWDDNQQSYPRFIIERTGNVGIGVASPGKLFSVVGVDGRNSTTYLAEFVNADNGSDQGHGVLIDGGNNANHHLFQVNAQNSAVFAVKGNGNVGIGTTSPSQALDVNGYIKATNTGAGYVQGVFVAHSSTSDTPSYRGQGYFTYNEDLDVSWFMGTPYTNGDFFCINRQHSTTSFDTAASYIGNTNTDNFLSITNTGYVGIGTTSPSALLDFGTSIQDNKIHLYASGNDKYGMGIRGSQLLFYSGGLGLGSGGITFGKMTGTTYTENMRVTNDGNVGIGTTSPSEILQTNKNSAGDIVGGYFTNSQANSGAESVSLAFGLNRSGGDFVRQVKAITFGTEQQWTGTPSTVDGYLAFSTVSNETVSEKMRITSGGEIQVGNAVGGSDSDTGTRINATQMRQSSSGTGAHDFHDFYRGTEGSLVRVGNIRTTGTATAYNTSSDYRLKENVVEMAGALDRVSQLKPSRFNFIADADKTVDGFLAHEVQEIVPEAITGEKDAVDEKGNPEYQGIDQSKLVPLLVGAIQELKAEIETLKTQINN